MLLDESEERSDGSEYDSPNTQVVRMTRRTALNAAAGCDEVYEASERNILYIGNPVPECARNIQMEPPRARAVQQLPPAAPPRAAPEDAPDCERITDRTCGAAARGSISDLLVMLVFLFLLSLLAHSTRPRTK